MINIEFTNIQDTLNLINKYRLSNKEKWIFVSVVKGSNTLHLKSFNTSIQILKLNEIKYHSTFDQKVKDWKDSIKICLEKLQEL